MDTFEQQFEDLDLRAEYMENAMSSSTAMTTPESEVQNLMQQVRILLLYTHRISFIVNIFIAQVAEENDIEFESNLNAIGVGQTTVKQSQKSTDEDKALEERLKKLQGI